jgi:hypothetical protein
MNQHQTTHQPNQQTPDEREGLPSASSLDADMRCLGRRNLIRDLGIERSPAGEAADKGTRIHEALENGNYDKLSDSEKITASIIEYQEGQLVDSNNFEGSKIIKEERYWLTDLKQFKGVFSGKPDRIHVNGSRALNINYKTGFSFVVPIERNWQVRSECVLIAENLQVTEVLAALIHPHHPETFRQEATFNIGHLTTYRETILKAVEQMDKPDAPRTPNPVSCMYCPAKTMCKEHKFWIDSVAKDKTSNDDRSPEQRGERLNEIKYVAKSFKEEEDRMKQMLKADPNSVFGWRLVPSGKREINDIPKASTVIKSTWGEGVLNSSTSISIPSVEQAVYDIKKPADKKYTKVKAEEEVGIILANYISKTMSDPKLLPVSKPK